MVYAVILAGGKGERMRSEVVPKQFIKIGGREILLHTVLKFAEAKDIDRIVVIVPGEWVSYTKDLLRQSGTRKAVTVAPGGSDRTESLLSACSHIQETFALTPADILVTHDAVRPFVTARIIEENVRFAAKYGAANTMIPVIDTVAVSRDGDFMHAIPPRKEIYQVQTPQSFRLLPFFNMLKSLTQEEKSRLTDASNICLLRGVPVKIVIGEQENIKLTTPHDIVVAEAVLARQTRGERES